MQNVINRFLFVVKSIFDKDAGLNEDAMNIPRYLQRKALKETGDFVENNMLNTDSFHDKYSLLEYSINSAKINGLFLEFGVYRGTSINFISSKIHGTVYGFDSFQGLPEDWRDGFKKGHFELDDLPKVNENVTLIKGWFDKTLPHFLTNNDQLCSFIHIDCDLYSSTKTILGLLKKRITDGTIIVFDEFFNYPGWKNGEYKAFMEFIKDNSVDFEYIGYSRYDQQVAIKIVSVKMKFEKTYGDNE